MDKFLASGGYGCDMSFIGPKGKAFIYWENGDFHFDKVFFWSWYQPLANAGLSKHKKFNYCVGGEMPPGGLAQLMRDHLLLMPWIFVTAQNAWDLSMRNDTFFRIQREMDIELKLMKLQVAESLANECEAHGSEPQAKSPFFHNINGVNGVYDKKALPFHAAYAKWTIENVKDLDPMVEVGNELNHEGGVNVGLAITPEIVNGGIAPWNVLLGACMPQCKFLGYVDPDKPSTWYSEEPDNSIMIAHDLVARYEKIKNPDGTLKYPNVTHQYFNCVHNGGDVQKLANRPYGEAYHQMYDWWIDKRTHVASSNRICFSSDGAHENPQVGGRPSAARWKAMMLDALKGCPQAIFIDGRPKFMFDFLPAKQTTAQIVEYVDAMNDVHVEMFGVDLENRGNVPPLVVEPLVAKIGRCYGIILNGGISTGSIKSWKLDWGSGMTIDGMKTFQKGEGNPGELRHVYPVPSPAPDKTYTVKLTVTGMDGKTSTAKMKVIV